MSLILGRNYMETVLLTLMRMKLERPEMASAIAKQLEIELCGLASAMRMVEKEYHKRIAELVKRYTTDSVGLELRKCTVFEEIVDVCKRNPEAFGVSSYTGATYIERRCVDIATSIVEIAVKATMFALGLVPYANP